MANISEFIKQQAQFLKAENVKQGFNLKI